MSNVDITPALGKTISDLRFSENDNDSALSITFADGSKLTLFDDGQSCCETRYMRTDDNLAEYIGGRLLGAEVKDVPELIGFWKDEDEYGAHDVQFLEITTSKGSFVMSNHNEHNGYYRGFCIEAKYEQ
ncbi:MAG: hypothetical protein IPK48_06850 [Gammaproteobacteria bacterium]|nr:hypothetical protein [Gammaproteobacteria bacterium]